MSNEPNLKCVCGNRWFSQKTKVALILNASDKQIEQDTQLRPKFCQECNRRLEPKHITVIR